MAQGHETFYGQKTSPELAALEASKAEAWAAYQAFRASPAGSRARSTPPLRRRARSTSSTRSQGRYRYARSPG